MMHITSAWSDLFNDLAELTWHQNKVHYAARHGYKARYYKHPIHGLEGDIAWNRVEIWLDTLEKIPGGDWMFWTGCDAVISNPRLKLERFIETEKDFIFILDPLSQVVFADCFMLRACDPCRDMLKALLNSKLRDRRGDEQVGFTEYLFQGRNVDYQRALRANKGDLHLRQKAYPLLQASAVRPGIKNGKDYFVGDGHSHHQHGFLHPNDSWTVNHLVIHMGGKELDYRRYHLEQYCPDWKLIAEEDALRREK
jgi:hypothetical protein